MERKKLILTISCIAVAAVVFVGAVFFALGNSSKETETGMETVTISEDDTSEKAEASVNDQDSSQTDFQANEDTGSEDQIVSGSSGTTSYDTSQVSATAGLQVAEDGDSGDSMDFGELTNDTSEVSSGSETSDSQNDSNHETTGDDTSETSSATGTSSDQDSSSGLQVEETDSGDTGSESTQTPDIEETDDVTVTSEWGLMF